MTSFPHNNSRRDKVEAAQAEARRRNEEGAALLRRLFPSLNGPAFQRVTPPSKEA